MAGYTTPGWTNDAAPAIDADALTALGQAAELGEHPYGVCTSGSSNSNKQVNIDFSGTLTLFAGLQVRIRFANANTAVSPTLNVNGTGAAPLLYSTGIPADSSSWNAGEVVTLTYDGTNWIVPGGGLKSLESDIASIHAYGTTNGTGAMIQSGTYFYLNGSLSQAKTDIPVNAAFTSGTNYRLITAGGMNVLRALIDNLFIPAETTTDLNDVGPGIWWAAGSVGNMPYASVCVILCMKYSSGGYSQGIQVAFRRSGDAVYVRHQNNGTWSGWKQVAYIA